MDSRDFIANLTAEIPNNCGRAVDEMAEKARLENLTLVADDKSLQEAALRSGADKYVLIVADSSLLGQVMWDRGVHFLNPQVVLKRREVLLSALQKEVDAAVATVEAEGLKPPEVSVILGDPELFFDDSQFWRLLWSCAELQDM